MDAQITKRSALKFVILLGFVSLFADMTYEGARSIIGPYLSILGANAFIVGLASGFGELIGYSFRLLFGYLSDKTHKYWSFTIFGYIINLIAVPLLALAGNWPLSMFLIFMERFGKAVRSPAKDALLSYAAKQTGRGWGFGLHEALDQIGAILGPLFVTAILFYQNSYTKSFAWLIVPAVCSLAVLLVAWRLYPNPKDLEVQKISLQGTGLSKNYWTYIVAICCLATGFVDFPLVAYHFKKTDLMEDSYIPLLFSLAMAADGMAALIFGKLYDYKGMVILIIASIAACLFAPLTFLAMAIQL